MFLKTTIKIDYKISSFFFKKKKLSTLFFFSKTQFLLQLMKQVIYNISTTISNEVCFFFQRKLSKKQFAK